MSCRDPLEPLLTVRSYLEAMLDIILYSFLLSISPFGEARAGIPYAILNGMNVPLAFVICLVANLLIFPLFSSLIDVFGRKFWKNKYYRKGAIKLSRRAKQGVGPSVRKYSFWGLMIFVMVPLPGTGAYMGAIAAYILKIDRKKAFWATSLGVFVSCLIVAFAAYFGNIGFKMIF